MPDEQEVKVPGVLSPIHVPAGQVTRGDLVLIDGLWCIVVSVRQAERYNGNRGEIAVECALLVPSASRDATAKHLTVHVQPVESLLAFPLWLRAQVDRDPAVRMRELLTADLAKHMLEEVASA